ncbi:MAG: energy transducer TonB [Terriglobales bacterium]|jgi:protein TonB
MFADSLLDSSASERGHRRRTALSSFLLQAAAVAAFLLFSLLRVERLPPVQWASALVAPAPVMNVATVRTSHSSVTSIAESHPLSAPRYEPTGITPEGGPAAPPAIDFGHLGIGGNGPGVPFSTGYAMPVIAPPPTVNAKPERVSRMMEGNLIHRVQPIYPPLARQARIQGPVVLRAVISREGIIEKLQAISGAPILEQAAIEAVKQWRYKPYLLDGEPIEVETQVTVNFSLGQ